MSKQIRFGPEAPATPRTERRHPAGIWLVSLFIVALLFAPSLLTQAGLAQRPAVGNATSHNAAVVAATDAVLKETSEIRQLSILRPVKSGTQARAEIERSVVKNLDEDMTPAEAHTSEVVLKKLGLAPAEFQYRDLMIRLLTEQVAGYYDPKTQQFYLADWIDIDGQKPIMAHELTHALQDQHFNLCRFEHWPKGDSDAELAAHALIEGDATVTMMLYMANDPMRALAFLKSLGAKGTASEELDKAPRALRETLLFPYQEGAEWTRSLYKRGGWNEVSQAFTTLPQSTEQVMHPEKYFSHEAPVKVSIPDVSNLLNAGNNSALRTPNSTLSTQSSSLRIDSSLFTLHLSLRGAWRRLDYDVNGEWGFYLLLDQFLKSPAESKRAAAGWGGDRYEVYEGPNGQACVISLSVWDTENDAREFFDAYVKRTELRYPDATPLVPTPNTQSPTPSKAFRTSEGVVTIELRGKSVVILEGLRGRVDSNALLKSLWQ